MPWKYDKYTSTRGEKSIEELVDALGEATFIAQMQERGIPLEELATRGKLQCNVCGETIENYDDAVRCENKPVHNHCLVCIACNRQLGDFKVKFFKNSSGKLFYCEICLLAEREKCPYCKGEIEVNRGKIYKSRKYHRPCLELIDVCDECGRSLVDSTHMLALDPEIDYPEGEGESPMTTEPATAMTTPVTTITPASTMPKTPESTMKEAPELIEGEGEGEETNLLEAKKQYCQECFKRIYDMEICHICKGPLKKHEEPETEDEAATSVGEALKVSSQKLSAHQKGQPILPTASKAFQFPDGAHPEDFLFEDYICHWDCMKCFTCQKELIGEKSFCMAEKHKVWCTFCAETKFGMHRATVLGTPSPTFPVPTGAVPRTSLGSNIQIGPGFAVIKDYVYFPNLGRYIFQERKPPPPPPPATPSKTGKGKSSPAKGKK